MLCRALKTRGNTPKYGLIFHSSFIGRAKQRNKGRISRYLANKCSMASRYLSTHIILLLFSAFRGVSGTVAGDVDYDHNCDAVYVVMLLSCLAREDTLWKAVK